MKKIYILLVLLLILISIVEVVYLAHLDTLASESMSAEKLRNKIAAIDEENQILQFEILSHSSILIVSSRAAELGFEKPKKFLSLKDPDSIALKHE